MSYLFLLLCGLLVAMFDQPVSAQEPLPDSISGNVAGNCVFQRTMIDPRLCCDSTIETQSTFCPIQCLSSMDQCMCVDIESGLSLGLPIFSMGSVTDCNSLITTAGPTTAAPTTAAPTATAPTAGPTTEAPTIITASPTTGGPDEDEDDEEESSSSSRGVCNCTEIQVCLRVGRYGFLECVDQPTVGDRCDGGDDSDDNNEMEDSDSTREDSTGRKRNKNRARKNIRGAKERRAYGQLERVEVECQDGLVCLEVEEGRSECQAENQNGVCVLAREQSPSLVCSPEGDFEPLQCQTENGVMVCSCVQPSSGSVLPNSTVTITPINDIPDCNAQVFDDCVIGSGSISLGVPHGEFIVDVANCRRCLCDDGTLVDCEASQTCQRIASNPRSCSYRGETIPHSEKFEIGCNECGCYNGNIRCTRRPCRSSYIQDTCTSCDTEPYSQMCGFNGVTYSSLCHAVYCSGQVPFTLIRGACSNARDVCSMFPCEESETCVKKGGTACFDGCEADDLRTCVNIDGLVCEEFDDEDDSTSICAKNGRTYSSLCHLLQDDVGVAYVGACGSKECSGSAVCGTDGVTYENICILRSVSANAKFDYEGECVNVTRSSVEDVCKRVNEENRCTYNSNNCRRLALPEDGCCPICGGIIFVALDLFGMREYVRLNPSLLSLDSFYELLVQSDIVPREITQRCDIDFSLVSRSLQIILSAKTADEEDFCSDQSEVIASIIDNPSETALSYFPDALQFATAAVAGSPVSGSLVLGSNGSQELVPFNCLMIFVIGTVIYNYFQ